PLLPRRSLAAAGLAQLPEKLGRSGVAASRASWGLDHYAPNRHDTRSTTARSVDEVALIRDTISHYAPVLIAPLSIQIRRAGVQKKLPMRRPRGRKKDWWPADTAPDPKVKSVQVWWRKVTD